eukprot:CAMPEP_0171115884 /NCGR_PEP_ID=MMETSP0766_2-20121228/89061_1 /TAXON_ID=439317 /ORGANISM="Gambierdiscus australes, Strain CAWD 149" /LENGTH=90 /DNA_ID=CAMNT_0011578281 /DNA_START=19 /DNA_END=289 /DNA_ORIENTATION=+
MKSPQNYAVVAAAPLFVCKNLGERENRRCSVAESALRGVGAGTRLLDVLEECSEEPDALGRTRTDFALSVKALQRGRSPRTRKVEWCTLP